MKKEEKQLIKEKAAEVKNQKIVFKKKLIDLKNRQFTTSLNYEARLLKDDGKAHLDIDLSKVNSPFSPYSDGDKLDNEIYEYIDDHVYYLRAEVPVVINFKGSKKLNDEDKTNIEKCVKRHYKLAYEDYRITYIKTITWGVLLTIIGLILLISCSIFTSYYPESLIFTEIGTILSWVFIWEAADKFFFSGHDSRTDIKNSAQLALAEVTFSK